MFLSPYRGMKGRNKWSGTDTENLFLKNKNTFDMCYPMLKWKYATENVTYKYNNAGFRNNSDFNEDTDFSNSYAVFGCSFVEGIGNHSNETIPSYIERKTGVVTYNFGLGGTGPDVIFFNVLKLMSFKNPPKKIFILWPEYARFSHYHLKVENEKVVSRDDDKNILALGVNLMHFAEFKKNYRPNYLVDTEILYYNKLLYMSRLRDLLGNRLIEMDILEHSISLDSPDKDAVSHAFGWSNIDEKYINDSNWILNNWFCRDIVVNNHKLERASKSLTDDFVLGLLKLSVGGHWGSAKNEIVADLLISKMRGKL